MMKYLYVLLLEKGYYQVGLTNHNPRFLLKGHYGTISELTKHYKPIKYVYLKGGNYDGFDEDALTKKMMNIHGINRVRGGSYSNIILTKEQMFVLNAEMYYNKCITTNV